MAVARLLTAEFDTSVPTMGTTLDASVEVIDTTLRKVVLSRKSIDTGEYGSVQFVGMSVVKTYP